MHACACRRGGSAVRVPAVALFSTSPRSLIVEHVSLDIEGIHGAAACHAS